MFRRHYIDCTVNEWPKAGALGNLVIGPQPTPPVKHLLFAITALVLSLFPATAGRQEITPVSVPALLAAYTDSPDLSHIFEDGPLVRQSRPWYDGLLGNWFVRLMIFGAIFMGLKSLFGNKKSGSPPPSQQTQPTPLQRPASSSSQPPKTAAPPSASAPSYTPSQGTWLYRANEKEFGPFDETVLRQLCRAGVITTTTQIRRVNGGNWITYADVFGNA